MLYQRVLWGDHSAYKNEKGEVIGELFRAVMAIQSYDRMTQK